MNRMRWLLMGVALGCASSAALAFQEQKGGGGPQPKAGVVQVPPRTDFDLKNTGTSIAETTGTEVRIPGLGKLGVLPKLDFGLELLYGVNDQKFPEPAERGPGAQSDDVQIRGSLKHRF